MLSIALIFMSIFVLISDTPNENYAQLQIWEIFASLDVFPFLSQLAPYLIKMDDNNHKKVWECIGTK